jgi:DNA-binding transcriptional LysR family regulator
MRLTSAGELFVQYIRGRAAELEQVRSHIEELQGLRRGRVRIVASQALAPAFLPHVVASFRQAHPLAVHEVRIGDHLQALDELRAFETDLALVFNLAAEADIEVLASFDQPLMAVMHRDHPLAARPGVRVRDCANYPLVLPHRDLGGRQLLESFLAGSSVQLRPVIESNSFEFLRGCLYHGNAVSFQIAIGTVEDGGALVARPLEDKHFAEGRLVLAALRGRQLPVIAHAFARHLEAALRQRDE